MGVLAVKQVGSENWVRKFGFGLGNWVRLGLQVLSWVKQVGPKNWVRKLGLGLGSVPRN